LFAKKYIVNTKDIDDVKAMNKLFSGSYFLMFLGWFVFAIFMFCMNPIIHNNNQEDIGSDIIMQEMMAQENVDMDNDKKMGQIKIKSREAEIHDDLKHADESSADDYEKFLNANKQ
jgi:hypothetical protein